MKMTAFKSLVWLGGPLIWTAHFLVVYASESLVCSRGGNAEAHSMLIIAATLIAAAAVVSVIWINHGMKREAVSSSEGHIWMDRTATIMAMLSLVAICWTALPSLLLSSCASGG